MCTTKSFLVTSKRTSVRYHICMLQGTATFSIFTWPNSTVSNTHSGSLLDYRCDQKNKTKYNRQTTETKPKKQMQQAKNLKNKRMIFRKFVAQNSMQVFSQVVLFRDPYLSLFLCVCYSETSAKPISPSKSP